MRQGSNNCAAHTVPTRRLQPAGVETGPLPGRKCSHIARVQSKRRPAQQPEDNEYGCKSSSSFSKHSNDGLQLNPPRLRPGSKHQASKEILDWRSVRARFVQMERSGLLQPGCSSATSCSFNSSIWAHELPAPEVGCVLVARQDCMDFFDRTVVLLAAHDTTHGSVGFVLNKPSPLRLCEVQLSATAQGILDTFGGQRLQLGGPVHMETLTLLHAFGGISGAQKVSEGVYYGGLPAAVDLVRSGLAKSEDFKLLLGMTGWAPGQLEHEVASGSWFVAATGQGLVLPSGSQQLPGRAPGALWKQLRLLIGQPVKDRANYH